jgi:hypothetical protein
MVDHIADKANKTGEMCKAVRETRVKLQSFLQKYQVRPDDIGLFVDFIGTRFDVPRRTPQAIAMRALEECVELCLATGAHPGAIHLVVGDSLANQALKASRVTGKTVFPSEVSEEYDAKEVGGEAADVLLCLRDLEYVAGVDVEHHAHRKFNLLRAAQDELYMSPSGTVRKRKPHVTEAA